MDGERTTGMCKRITFVLAGSLGPVGMVDEGDSGSAAAEAGGIPEGDSLDGEIGSHKGEATRVDVEGQDAR